MMPDVSRNALGTAFVGLAVVLFVAPALFPVGAVLVHDTDVGTEANRTALADEGIPVIEYGDLSARGKTIYERALRRDGEYTVTAGTGAPEFSYPDGEIARIVIVRPADASGLPPADEPTYRIERMREELNESEGTPSAAQKRELERRKTQIAKFDMMVTHRTNPELSSPSQLLRLFAVLFAVVFAGLGGYLLASK